jgi:hypothetical protein
MDWVTQALPMSPSRPSSLLLNFVPPNGLSLLLLLLLSPATVSPKPYPYIYCNNVSVFVVFSNDLVHLVLLIIGFMPNLV